MGAAGKPWIGLENEPPGTLPPAAGTVATSKNPGHSHCLWLMVIVELPQKWGNMAIVHRRIFYGQVGNGDQLVQLMNEGNEGLARFGAGLTARVLTDAMTGRSDRGVVEWELENIGDMESAMAQVMGSPDGAAFFNGWMEKLNGLIEYAEGEFWTVR